MLIVLFTFIFGVWGKKVKLLHDNITIYSALELHVLFLKTNKPEVLI